MKFLLHFLLLALIPWFAFAADPAPKKHKPNKADKAFLEKWGNRYRSDFGVLLTPPVGKINPEVAAARAKVNEILQNLLGERLKKADFHLIVNIYDSVSPNAHMANETNFLKKFPVSGSRMLGIEKDGKPIYELAITTKLLRLADTEDELASVIGHEVAGHLFQHHVEEEKLPMAAQANKWWSGQQHEAVADYEGVKAMVGKYDLPASKSMLEKLGALDKGDDDYSEFISAAETHHHRGVRIALDEAAIEYYRKSDESAAPRKQIPLSDNFKPRANPRTKYFSHEFEENKETFVKYLKTKLLKGELANIDVTSLAAKSPMVKFSQSRAMEEQLTPFFMEMVEVIRRSKATKQNKVSALLEMMSFLDHSLWGMGGFTRERKPVWESLSMDESNKVLRFLAEQSTGPDKFNADTYLVSLKQAFIDSEKSGKPGGGNLFMLPMDIAKSTNFQRDLNKLEKTVEAWKDFAVKSARNTYVYEGKNDLSRMHQIFMDIRDQANSGKPLTEKMRADLIEALKGIDFKKALKKAKDRNLVSQYGDFLKWLDMDEDFYKADEKFQQAVGEAVKSATPEYRDAAARVFTRNVEKSELAQLEYYLDELGDASKYGAYSEEVRAQLAKDFGTLSQRLAKDGLFNEIIIPDHVKLVPELMDIFSRAINLPGSEAERKNTLETFLSFGEKNFAGMSSETQKRFAEYLEKNLNKDSFVAALTENTWPGIDKAIAARIEAGKKISPEELKMMGGNPEDPVRDVVDAYVLNRKRTLLDMARTSPEWQKKIFKDLTFADLGKILDSFDASMKLAKDFKENSRFHMSADTLDFVMQAFFERQDQAKSFEEWKNAYLRIHQIDSGILEYKNSYAGDIQKYLQTKWFPTLNETQIYEALKSPEIRRALDSDIVAEYLVNYTTKQAGADAAPEAAAKVLRQLDTELQLVENAPELRNSLKEKFLFKVMAQPNQISIYYPDLNEGKTTTEITQSAAKPIRGMSFAAALAEKQSDEDRMHFIDYLLSRRDDMPKFVEEEAKKIRKYKPDAPILENVRNMRAKVKDATLLERTLFIDGFMAGPGGLANTKTGPQFLIDHLLKAVAPESQKNARIIANALVKANADNRSLAFSYLLSQKSAVEGVALTESDIFAAGLTAHGVPGVKFGQYLGFTSKFKKYTEALEKFQDQANPLSYAEVIDLLKIRFGGQWPENLKVKKVLGFGSVHVAVDVIDQKTGQEEVVTVLRNNIQTATKEDFRRFNLFLQALADADEGKGDFSSYLGLSNIVEKSVNLDMDSEASFQEQKRVYSRYDYTKGRVHVESVPAYSNENGNIFMALGKGQTARKLWQKDPITYKEVMKVVSEAEMNILLGMKADGVPPPIPTHANPDFHDGQVMIDIQPDKIRAQILDFGQAVEINNLERMQGLDMLRIVTHSETPEKAAEIMNHMSQAAIGKDVFTVAEMKALLDSSKERMDVFVRLISEANLKGYKIPIPAVHWVLGVNRQIVLGEKIGVNNAATFRNLIITRKLGLSEDVFLATRKVIEPIEVTYDAALGKLHQVTDDCRNYFAKLLHKGAEILDPK